jgi:hypothetical protein
MAKYLSRLSEITGAPVILSLRGPGGFLAVTDTELFYLNHTVQHKILLSQIKRVVSNKETRKIDLLGSNGTLLEIPPAAFDRDELKQFLYSLRDWVKTSKPPRREEFPVQEPEPEALVSPFPRFEKSTTPLPAQLVQPTDLSLPTGLFSSDVAPQATLLTRTHDIDAPITLAENNGASHNIPPVQTPVVATPVQFRPSRHPTSLPLKVSAFLTASLTAGYFVSGAGNAENIWPVLVVASIGLSLTLIQWRLAEP